MAGAERLGEVEEASSINFRPVSEGFVVKWSPGGKSHRLGERAGAQIHFLELCDLLGVDVPDDPDNYCFERGLRGLTGTVRFADVWKRGCFAWEFKKPGADLGDALEQLMRYALPLHNPPLLIVSDRDRIEIHTHFTGYPSKCTVIEHAELKDRRVRARLAAVFNDPYSFKPDRDSRQVTESAAAAFATVADELRKSGVPADKAAHFLTQCVFCYFAEDIGLLENDVFKRLLLKKSAPDKLRRDLNRLFSTMREGGAFGADDIPWFNGGLFNTIEVPALPRAAADTLVAVADLNWSAIDPSIFGTLFERGLDPEKRAQIGAFYTGPDVIMRLVEPAVKNTILAEWEVCKSEINGLLSQRDLLKVEAKTIPTRSKKLKARASRMTSRAKHKERTAEDVFNEFLERLRTFRVLDAACGSGNFLYLSLKALKDVEKQANLDAETLGLKPQFPVTGPENVLGIEIDPYAAELARMTVWIGELQWRKQNGYGWKLNPVLDNLDHIECRDALLTPDRRGEAEWPSADVIVGNPPFVGNKKMRTELGDEYTQALRDVYGEAVLGSVDLVCYWFHKALKEIKSERTLAVGLVATQALRRGTSRSVLDAVCSKTRIFEAWSDEPWVNEGAAVRVSLVCFGPAGAGAPRLDGASVDRITADLSGRGDIDLTSARPLKENLGIAFQGSSKVGPFEIPGVLAREWLLQPNPDGRSNADVLRPWANGQTLAKRPGDDWIIDFGTELTEAQASLYEKPYEYVLRQVKPERDRNNREAYRRYWWRHAEARSGLRQASAGLSRVIATPRVAKHRFFVWLDASVLPDTRLYVVARDDNVTFGVLSSRIHKVWALANASMHGVGNDPTYNARSCFETFPFPLRTSRDFRSARGRIDAAARELDRLRDAWLNPPDWVERLPEVVPVGLKASPYPMRVVPKWGHGDDVAQRTLTNLYNSPPAWLKRVHAVLDDAVAAAYGWIGYSDSMDEAEILRRLAALNAERSTTALSGSSELIE